MLCLTDSRVAEADHCVLQIAGLFLFWPADQLAGILAPLSHHILIDSRPAALASIHLISLPQVERLCTCIQVFEE